MNTEILEGNKLIAEFMGLKKVTTNYLGQLVGVANYNGADEIKGPIQYESDWNELMPVIEKIETLPIPECIDQFYILVEHDNRTDFKGWYWQIHPFVKTIKSDNLNRFNVKIEACYNAVVWFIKWYNLQNKEA